MSDNIKVVVKVRPLISREIEEKHSYQWRVKNNTLYQLDQNGRDFGPAFTFDKVYDKDTKTCDVYNDIAKPIVEAATAGFNGTIFAYGQTSSGKTYTMTGTEVSPGIIPLAVLNLFEIIKNVPDRDFLVRVSYIEIYNETLKDLLNVEKENIKIHESLQGIKVDATERVATSPEEVLEAMKEGEANRQTGVTNMNEKSSRSHSIFQITIESREHLEGAGGAEGAEGAKGEGGECDAGRVNVSQLNLVDLAGSERAGQTGATGLRFKEGTHINKSLSALALVIKQLSEDPNKYANYRDSKLTRILQNSLGGNAKTSIICAITPAAIEETISTLQFANRAKAIKNKPKVNAVATDASMIQSLTKQLSRLQAQLDAKKKLEVILETKKNVEQDNYNLQKQIANLQKLILNSFGQRSCMEMMSQRRKQPPRRITISTLHSIEEDTPPPIARFCTPALKYNPMTTPGASDFVPIQSRNTLSSLTEEPPRLITPPPQGKKVSFEGEIIELDSDDDDCSSTQVCSPYHPCRDKSKTPPCILRQNAKLAEKNYKDMVQFTEREKIYTPSVIELLEKLEQNSAVISRLKDEVDILQKQSKEKDFEVDQLKDKNKKTEEQVKSITLAKADLEAQCKDFVIKVTDWEVSYETLKNKFKRREQDLLSLIEENKAKKSDSACKTCIPTLNALNKNQLDNISQVSSETDSHVTESSNDTSSGNLNTLVASLQKELSLKNDTIKALEADIHSQKQRLEFLEISTQELEGTINNVTEKLSFVEEENSLLKSTIDTLNSTIKSQKVNLETANSDMESYNSVIQELKIQLMKTDNLPNIDINDSILEDMIANEEKFIANNENIKNVIHSFKLALEIRNKEINQLKSSLESKMQGDGDSQYIKEDLEAKNKEIHSLNEEINQLKDQIKEHIVTIDKLVRDKNNFVSIEQDLGDKISIIKEQSKLLEKSNQEYADCVKNLEECNNRLVSELDNASEKEKNVLKINEDLISQLHTMKAKVSELEVDIRNKEEQIASIHNENEDTQLQTLRSALHKIQNILTTLTGDIQDVPDVLDNFVNIFNTLLSNLNLLESLIINTLTERKVAIENASVLEKALNEMKHCHDSEMSELNTLLENSKQKLNLTIQEKIDVESYLEEYKNNYINLQEDILIKDNIVTDLKETKAKLLNEKEALLMDNNRLKEDYTIDIKNLNESFKLKQDALDKILADKDKNIEQLSRTIEEMQRTLEEQTVGITLLNQKLHDVNSNTDRFTGAILEKVSNLLKQLNIENVISDEINDKAKDICPEIILSLDKITNCIAMISNLNNHEHKDPSPKIENEMKQLKQQNLELIENLKHIEGKNSKLTAEMEKILLDNKCLNGNLINSNELIHQLRNDLKNKCDEIQVMGNKIEEWKEQFTELDTITKEQLYELRLENTKLKSNRTNFNFNRYSMNEMTNLDSSHNNGIRESLSSEIETIFSPKSLVTICCTTIMDHIQPKNDSKSITSSSSDSDIDVQNTTIQENSCICSQLKTELVLIQNENAKLIDIVEQLKFVNQQLIDDREEVRKEIDLLLEPVYELQRKVVNHKTNLSILTATTYAENKSLKSQVKSLQHHHNRFHTVCQRDIPAFKRQLYELLCILKGHAVVSDSHNVSFKRYSLPDVLENNTTVSNLRNESTLDEDLLMLDTNVTLTTADNTLVGCDQTCLDITQILYNEAACQTSEINKLLNEPQKLYSQIELLSEDNQNMLEKLEVLKEENRKLRDQLDRHSVSKNNNIHNNVAIETESTTCRTCINNEELRKSKDILEQELQKLSKKLQDMEIEKSELQHKYTNLALEVPSTEILIKKMSESRIEFEEALKNLQKENESLSTQVIDNISEIDDLNKELDRLKLMNTELSERCSNLEKYKNSDALNVPPACPECVLKDKFIQSMQSQGLSESHSKLNKSYSDSETSSRFNKICTLQSELHAGREDCRVLTEDVKTIKHHLERSNISMDLDESLGDSNSYAFSRDSVPGLHLNTSNIPESSEKLSLKLYMTEKFDCLNYCIEKTGINRESINCDINIIDIMKMFYNNLVAKHGNEVENLVNKLKDYDEGKNQLQSQMLHINAEYSRLTKELEDKNSFVKKITDIISLVKNNIKHAEIEIMKPSEDVDIKKSITIVKENLLSVLDSEFGVNSVNLIHILIDKLVTKQQNDLSEILGKYTKLQEQAEMLTTELTSVNENLAEMRRKLTYKENEYNLLKAQKEKIHEINDAVTLDIIRREQSLQELVTNYYRQLLEFKIVNLDELELLQPLHEKLDLLFGRLIDQYRSQMSKAETKTITERFEEEKNNLYLELNNAKTAVASKEKQIAELKSLHSQLQEVIKEKEGNLKEKENKLQELKVIHEDLRLVYDKKVEENKANVTLNEKLTEEIRILKESISQKEAIVESLSKLDDKVKEHIDKIKDLQIENTNLKSVCDMINKEKETYVLELIKSGETIKQNNEELNNMTAEILIMRETIKDSTSAIDTLKHEAQSLLKQNAEMKQQFEQKCRDCSRLETNIKTHEKTAEIQSRMIIRLQKQKEDDDKCINENNKQLEDISHKFATLQNEYEKTLSQLQATQHEIDELKNTKESLEARVSELSRSAEGSRRRRQSTHDSKRHITLQDLEDGKIAEMMFESRQRPDDLFMDVDDDLSNRSTPNRLSRGRDSLLSRTDQKQGKISKGRFQLKKQRYTEQIDEEFSEKDDEHSSRPSSVVETRRRRQSSHDLHRSVARYTPEPPPTDQSRLTDETKEQKQSNDSEANSQLRQQLTACKQELEELKERYKELDEECETCAEYLREREDQCIRLKREKTALEKQLAEVKQQLQLAEPSKQAPHGVQHVGVNTDEDWTKLHSLVVDRMSYDAEVEKNKKLAKTIEELRYKNQDLKNTLGKMQKALEKQSEKHYDTRELEGVRSELRACRAELEQARRRSAQLRHDADAREQHIRRLTEAKAALEAKVQEYQEMSGSVSRSMSVRKKRQTMHDLNRSPGVDLSDAATETSDDFLSNPVERDDTMKEKTNDAHSREIKQLRLAVEKLSQQKATLEKQLVSNSHPPAHPTLYVAAGSAIVQNQQLTDVMKENQKLKKMNAKLVSICKKRGKSEANRENEDPSDQC